jgi:predicted HicB family RNase H-like nuclease
MLHTDTPQKKLTVRIPEDLHRRLEDFSRQTDRSLNYTAKRLLEYAVVDLSPIDKNGSVAE